MASSLLVRASRRVRCSPVLRIRPKRPRSLTLKPNHLYLPFSTFERPSQLDPSSTLHRASTDNNNDQHASSTRQKYPIDRDRPYIPSNQPISIYDMDYKSLRHIESIEQLQEMVDQLEDMPTLTEQDIGPLIVPLTRRTCERHFGERGAELTERILFHCLGRLPSDLSQRVLQPDLPYPLAKMYTRAMIAWGNLRTPQGAERAQRIFALMESEYQAEAAWTEEHVVDQVYSVRAPRPDRPCYKSLLRAWAVSNAPHGVARAYEILREMEGLSGISKLAEEWQPDGPPVVDSNMYVLQPPDRASYNTVLSAYAKMPVLKKPIVLNRVKSIIAHMDKLHQATGSEEYMLDWISYHSLLRAYDKYIKSTPPRSLDRVMAVEVEDVLRRIYKADQERREKGQEPIYSREHLSMPWAYGVAIEAWINVSPVVEGIQRADDIIMTMLGKKKLRDLPNPRLGQWPLQSSIIQVVRSWQRSGVPDTQARIQRLLHIVMETPFERIYLLEEAMEQWTRSDYEHAPEIVEKMLEWSVARMPNRGKPTGRTFSIALKAWLRSSADDAAYRAELILRELVQLFERTKDPCFEPREVHLRYVMTTWLNRCPKGRRYHGLAGNLYPAEHVEKFLHLYRNYDWISNLKGHYAMAIRAWAKQRIATDDKDEPDPLHRACALLNDLEEYMGDKDEPLPAFASNWVIEACTVRQPTEEGRRRAFDKAMETFRRAHHNPRTFVSLLKVLRAQLFEVDADYLRIMEELFRECCARGLLTQDVVWEVLNVAPAGTIQRLFGVSYSYTSYIVQSRQDRPTNADGSYSWNVRPPTSLLVRNLPRDWSKRAENFKRKHN